MNFFDFISEQFHKAHFNLSRKTERDRSVAELESLFFDLAQHSSAALFLEVGANDARAARQIARDQPEKKVLAFEANPYTFDRFNTIYDFPNLNIEYTNLALTDKTGTAVINVRKKEDGRPCADGQASLLKHTNYPPGHLQIEVEASTIEEVVLQYSNKEFILWMDVEGAVQSVLNGIQSALQYLQIVFVEVETKVIWSDQWKKKHVDNFFASAGFVEVARDYQARWQCNVIYVPESLLQTHSVQHALRRYQTRIRKKNGTLRPRIRFLFNLFSQLRL